MTPACHDLRSGSVTVPRRCLRVDQAAVKKDKGAIDGIVTDAVEHETTPEAQSVVGTNTKPSPTSTAAPTADAMRRFATTFRRSIRYRERT
jgi:hypothetical protein